MKARGGPGRGQGRTPAGTPRGRKPGVAVGAYKDETQKAQPVTFRLYEADLAGLEALVGQGYAKDRTAAIRRAIAEALGQAHAERG